MRITGTVVTRVAKWTQEVTGGAFREPNRGADLGHGARYIDNVCQLVWLGRYGAREACAYYGSAGCEWASLADRAVPEWVIEVMTELAGGQPPGVRAWAERGHADAMSRRRTQG